MAISPIEEWPTKVGAVSPQYPFGEAQNVTTQNDGTGTPWIARLINDIFGFQQALLDAVGESPSGNPEAVGASQYLGAINTLIANAGGGDNFEKVTSSILIPNATNLRSFVVEGVNVTITIDPNALPHVGLIQTTFLVDGFISFPSETILVNGSIVAATNPFPVAAGESYYIWTTGAGVIFLRSVGGLDDSLHLDGSNFPQSILRASADWAMQGSGQSFAIYPSQANGSAGGAAALRFQGAIGSNDAWLLAQADQSPPFFQVTPKGADGFGFLQLSQFGGTPYLQIKPSFLKLFYQAGNQMLAAENEKLTFAKESGFQILSIDNDKFTYIQDTGAAGFEYENGRFFVRNASGLIVFDTDDLQGAGLLVDGSNAAFGKLRLSTTMAIIKDGDGFYFYRTNTSGAIAGTPVAEIDNGHLVVRTSGGSPTLESLPDRFTYYNDSNNKLFEITDVSGEAEVNFYHTDGNFSLRADENVLRYSTKDDSMVWQADSLAVTFRDGNNVQVLNMTNALSVIRSPLKAHNATSGQLEDVSTNSDLIEGLTDDSGTGLRYYNAATGKNLINFSGGSGELRADAITMLTIPNVYIATFYPPSANPSLFSNINNFLKAFNRDSGASEFVLTESDVGDPLITNGGGNLASFDRPSGNEMVSGDDFATIIHALNGDAAITIINYISVDREIRISDANIINGNSAVNRNYVDNASGGGGLITKIETIGANTNVGNFDSGTIFTITNNSLVFSLPEASTVPEGTYYEVNVPTPLVSCSATAFAPTERIVFLYSLGLIALQTQTFDAGYMYKIVRKDGGAVSWNVTRVSIA